jgi:hypothetical protein
MDARGPFVRLVMGVVVLKDVVVIVLFAVNMELVPLVRRAAVCQAGWCCCAQRHPCATLTRPAAAPRPMTVSTRASFIMILAAVSISICAVCCVLCCITSHHIIHHCTSQIIDHSAAGLGLAHLLLPLLSVAVSLTSGLLGGLVVGLALQYQAHARLASLVARLVPSGVSQATLAARCACAALLCAALRCATVV